MSRVSSMIAQIDLDGTLANYDKAIRRDMELTRSPHEPPITEELVSFPTAQVSFFKRTSYLMMQGRQLHGSAWVESANFEMDR